jgi:asparagine synthase (glutamine-hydrolysing)
VSLRKICVIVCYALGEIRLSGICGISYFDKAESVAAADLALMVRGLGNGAEEARDVINVGSVALAASRRRGYYGGIGELVVSGQPLALAFYGSLYNLSELSALGWVDLDYAKNLLRLYLKEGIGFLGRLNGEFSFAIWDGREEKLYLATDRFRVSPLFYYSGQDALVFSGRMKGILACPLAAARTLDLEAIVDVVSSSYIPTPKTIFNEIKKLPAGHFLTCQRGRIDVTAYWDISFVQPNRDETELERELKDHFARAVSVRLEADRTSQVGTFLSGGVDSSTVTGVLTQLTQRPVKSFSIGFGDSQFNEIDYSRIAARSFGSQHFEYFVTPRDTCDALPILLKAFDEPFANASAVPTYLCARMAQQNGVKILYAGDGGDELFAGNERYATQRRYDIYQKIPQLIRKGLIHPALAVLADRLKIGLAVKGKKYVERLGLPYPERLYNYGFFNIVPMAEVFDAGFLRSLSDNYSPYAAIRTHYFQAAAKTELDRQLYIDLKLAISDNDLFKVTRMTEAAGITVRYPFLDHRLADFAATVPAKIKMPGKELRRFFKRAYADLLPLEVITKKKHGFGLPIPVWLRTDKCLNEMMHDAVLSPRSLQRGYFRKRALEMIVERHKTDKSSFYGSVLWNLMMLELWHRSFVH